MQPNACLNQNHRRTQPPVRYCASCGEIVNDQLVVKKCSIEEHNKERRDMYKFCVHCGVALART